MKRILSLYGWALLMIIVCGAIFTLPSSSRAEDEHAAHAMEPVPKPVIEYWTCGMHPSVKVSPDQYDKGSTTCPICSMNLVPVQSRSEAATGTEEGSSPVGITLSERSRRLAGIETTVVERLPLFKEMRCEGVA